MSRVVKQYFYELNYLGELRNQLVHGINLDGEDYIIPTNHAIQEMISLSDLIMHHLDHECIVSPDELLTDIVARMLQMELTHVLVYHDRVFMYDLTRQTLIQAITHYSDNIQ